MLTKESLKEILQQNIVNISFTKIDGTERKMLCSLKEDLIPEREPSTYKKVENPDTLAVWDLQKDAFRSFRINSVNNYEIVEGPVTHI